MSRQPRKTAADYHKSAWKQVGFVQAQKAEGSNHPTQVTHERELQCERCRNAATVSKTNSDSTTQN